MARNTGVRVCARVSDLSLSFPPPRLPSIPSRFLLYASHDAETRKAMEKTTSAGPGRWSFPGQVAGVDG